MLLLAGLTLTATPVFAAQSTTVDLGKANPTAVGSAKGILLIGDDGVLDCMKSDSTTQVTGNHYKSANGLQAYAWAKHNVQSINTKCSSLSVDESIHNVIVYCGNTDNPTTTDYANLITTLQTKFPKAQISLHACDNETANAAMSSISGISVIDLYEVGEDPAGWRNKLISHFTGSNEPVVSTTTSGNITIDLDATTTKATVESQTNISSPTFNPMVTVIHSLNAKFASEDAKVYYVPTLEELPVDMKAFIESGAYDSTNMYHGFAAAYAGLYDIESKTQQYSNDTVYYNTTPSVYKGVNATRALEVLGYDLLLTDEECDIWTENGNVKAKYTTEELGDTVTLQTAIMNIYKALGQSCYQYNYAFLPDSTLNPETSPLQKEISQQLGSSSSWDNSEGACYVFTTRTNPDLYWHKAETDRIFTTVQDKYETYQLVSPSDVPTLAEYCQLLAGMLQTYGEPVMTKEEETLLLQVYGANMPTYLSDTSQLDSIKYLIAKGIFNFTEKKDYAWASPLTKEDLLNTLMAVYDKDSRATFKDVQITTDAQLVEEGYYPVAIEQDQTFVSGLSYMPVTNSEPYYDYLIEYKYLQGEADPAGGCTISGVQTGNTADDKEVRYREGVSSTVQYAGLVSAGNRKFYHFKVCKSVQGGFDIVLDKNTKIGIAEHIGGVMLDMKYVDDISYGNPMLLQFDDETMPLKFDKAVAQYWADKTRVEASETTGTASGNVNAFTYLSEDESVPILMEVMPSYIEKMSTCSINNVKLESKYYKAVGVPQQCGTATITRLKSGEGDPVTFQITGFKTFDEFRDNVNFDNISSAVYPGYRKDSESLLVPLKYLESIDIVKEAIQGPSHIELLTDNNTIYIDNQKKYIINGTGIYQAPKNATLYFKDKSGVLYVDYRAALGWATQYLDISNVQQGSVSLTYKSKFAEKVRQKPIVGMFGSEEIVDTVFLNGKQHMLLNSVYPLANYFIFYTNEKTVGTDRDTLVCIKPNWPYFNGTAVTDNTYDDSGPRKYVNEFTGINVKSKNVRVYVYQLTRTDKEDGTNPAGVTYTESHGYVYAPPEWNESSIANYFTPAINADDPASPVFGSFDQSILALPLVAYGNDWYSLHFNMFSSDGKAIPYGYAPLRYIKGNDANSNGVAKFTGSSWEATTEVGHIGTSGINMTNAPVGIQWMLTTIANPKKFSEVWDDSSVVFYSGALRMERGDKDQETYLYNNKIKIPVNSSNNFVVLRHTITGWQVSVNSESVLTYNPMSKVSLENFTVDPGAELNQFDWEGNALAQKLDSTDTFLTKSTIFVTRIIPQIVVYVCIALIALSLASNIKPWIIFCDKVVDVYSILTLGKHTVHTINMQGIFYSSLVGIGIFWLFMDGTVFQLFAWIVRAIVGIAVR